MRFNSSSLFVNTGRKPLSTMQKRKNNKNNVFLAVCVVIIAVLCIFVGLIVRVWVNYDGDNSEKQEIKTTAVVQEQKTEAKEKTKTDKDTTAEKAKTTDKKNSEKKTASKKTAKKATTKKAVPEYPVEGTESEYSKAVDKYFEKLTGTYAYGIYFMDGSHKYVKNTDKISNSAALGAFLTEYICAKIYTGEFDYDTNVGGQSGNSLIDKLIREGSVDAANTLINYFTPEKLNAYMTSKGYSSTYFGGIISDGNPNGSYTSVNDVIALMQNFYNKSKLFPYSDLYKRMRQSQVNSRSRNQLPYETTVANVSLADSNEMFDAAIIYTPKGNYMFVAFANGYNDDGSAANTAMAGGAKALYDKLGN